MKHYILLLSALLCLSHPSLAQNKIDQLVEKFSTIGHGTFTSAVERDPKTRKVKRVVKVLETRGDVISSLKSAFEKLRNESGYERTVTSDNTSISFWTESERQHRIYFLNSTGRYYPSGKVTIIIIYK